MIKNPIASFTSNQLHLVFGVAILKSLLVLALTYYSPSLDLNIAPSNTELPRWLRGLLNWDAGIYTSLSINPIAQISHRAFFPLFPTLISIVSKSLALNPAIAGLIIANTTAIISYLLLFQITLNHFSRASAWFTVILLMAYPGSFFMHMIYTESLFLCLSLLTFLLLQQDKYKLAGISAMLLVLCRPNGILILAPLIVLLLRTKYQGKFQPPLLYPVILASFGYIFFLYISYLGSGNPFIAYEAQNFFVAENKIRNLLHPIDWFYRNFVRDDFELLGMTNSILDRVVFGVFLGLLIASFKSLDKAMWIYALLMTMIPAFSGIFMSYMRIVMVVFPLFMQGGKYLACSWKADKIFVSAVLTVLCILQIYLVVLFSNGVWVN